MVLSAIFVVFTYLHYIRKSDQKSLKNGGKTHSKLLKKHVYFDANFCVEKLTTFSRIWTPKRVQADPKIHRKSKKNRKNQNSKIMEMQKIQKMQKTLKSDAPDLERTLKVGKIVSKSVKKSLGHRRFHTRFFQSVSNISCYA